MSDKEICDKIEQMLKKEKPQDVLEYVQVNHYNDDLTPKVLGELYLAYIAVEGWIDEEKKISPVILIEELTKTLKQKMAACGLLTIVVWEKFTK